MADIALSDLKVVELGQWITAPYCGKLLADLGADVVKIEDPAGGDPARGTGPFWHDVPHPDRSALFLYLNTNKKSVTLDVRTATGVRIFKELLGEADILVENNATAEMARLGFDYDALRRLNPRLIVVSITPFGQTGPYRDLKATDLIVNLMSGSSFFVPRKVRDASQPPLRLGGHQADFLAGLTGAIGAMLAVFSRDLNGLGQRVDISAQESLASFMRWEVGAFTHDFAGMFQSLFANRVSKQSASSHGAVGIFPCKDGYVAIGTREQHQWEAFVDMIGSPELAADPRFRDIHPRAENWSQIEPVVLEWTMKYTKDEIFREAQARRVPIFPCSTTEEVFDSAQFLGRGYFVAVEHPDAGRQLYPGAAFKLSRTPWQVMQPAPRLGEHNEAVLCDRLGYGRDDLVKFRQTGVI